MQEITTAQPIDLVNSIMAYSLALGGILLAVFAFLFHVRMNKTLKPQYAKALKSVSISTLVVALVSFLTALVSFSAIFLIIVNECKFRDFLAIAAVVLFGVSMVGAFAVTLRMLRLV